ncbi:hypothetical protein M378DRAFT_159459 [Amanita muscaria Koide BX008]|uniref:Extracellular serine-rich protein n=1 Tax=Amanita muscaria (strain Koide BX008) TaxID=946122 RepID=A0A0C2TKS2_AMAMK|nr:hypothetical protein M378DRAFT_159459 [Amanita muscaria Koide BX008]
MRFLPFAAALSIIPIVLGNNFDVVVGFNGMLAYNPTEVHANTGDTVTFKFAAGNHTATTTTFTNPCPPPPGGVGPNGFDTGFHMSPDTVTIKITDTNPRFVSCRQAAGAHCRTGMTMVINPTADLSEAQFRQNAINDQ